MNKNSTFRKIVLPGSQWGLKSLYLFIGRVGFLISFLPWWILSQKLEPIPQEGVQKEDSYLL